MSRIDVVWAALHFLPAFVWAIVAENTIRLLRSRRPRSTLFRLLPVLATLMAVAYCLFGLFELVHGEEHPALPTVLFVLYRLADVISIAAVVVFRHMSRFFPVREQPPGRAWLAVNYGSGVLVAALGLTFPLATPAAGGGPWLAYGVIHSGYIVVMLALSSRAVARVALRGGWRPGGLGQANRLDLLVLVGGALMLVGVAALEVKGGWSTHPTAINVLSVVSGLLFAVPIATRTLGQVVRGVLVGGTMLAVIVAVYFGVPAAAALVPIPALRRVFDLTAVVVLLIAVVPGQLWLRGQIERGVFGRTRRRRAELQAFLHTLSPELGTRECTRRALAELARVWQFRGVAVLFADGEAVVHGDVTLAPIQRVWQDAAAAGLLPVRSMVAFELRDLPLVLKEAMFESDIVELVPVVSPHRRWGHLFVHTSLLGVTFNEEDLQAVDAFADHLALVLDGTELLARAVAVERSLAHAETLAAIGELAARIAHDIRNPVTAARSLAQQLAREPASPFAAEHGLILAELERVERQVAALLRFARRDEYRFEAVPLGELVRATVAALRPRLEAANVAVALEVAPDSTARADREKLRQVLVNVIENAVDALAEVPGERRLVVSVTGSNGTATLRVADNGPGVPAASLPHVFEPFFTLKPGGTGLGLAIARRTIEAHGGRIEATAAPESGLVVTVALPALEGREGWT